MKKAFGVLLLVAACCTYLTCLFGNILIALYGGSALASVFGLLAMFTISWQIMLAFNHLRGKQ